MPLRHRLSGLFGLMIKVLTRGLFLYGILCVQGLSVYEKKKYVWKMLYIYMLGYDVDFGHMETVALISAPKYAEKQVYTPSQYCL